MRDNNTHSRIRLISSAIIFVALILIVRAYYIQIVQGDIFSNKADHQYTSPTQEIFDRGTIFFSTKSGTLVSGATLRSGFTASVNPKLVVDPESLYKVIGKKLSLDHDTFLAKATKQNDPYEELAKHVDEPVVNTLSALKLKGLSFYKDQWRYYPSGSLASQTLGFLAFQGDTLAPRYGLERSYDDTLRRNDKTVYVNFFAEVFSNLKKTIVDNQSLEGDVVTTIEPTVQAFAEKKIAEIHEQWHSKKVGIVIMNPKNGEIYALAATPTFDPNKFRDEKNVGVFSNPMVEDVYEMGSIIKPLTMAAGLDAKVVTAETTYNDTGSIELDGKKISNYDGKARGVIPMQEVLNQSLNLGVSFVVTKLGKERFANYMRNYGLGERTGIDLPNESIGLIKNLTSKRDVEYATASFGQGIALTPLSTARALSSLGNGGALVTPHLVKQIRYKLGVTKNIDYPLGRQVIATSTSAEITRMLVTVVDKALLNGKIKMPHYSIAAKTGTAQIAKEGGGGYDASRFLHSFFGYLPASDPKFLVFMYQLEPQNVQYASQTLGEPFSDIAKFLISYYQVPPDR